MTGQQGCGLGPPSPRGSVPAGCSPMSGEGETAQAALPGCAPVSPSEGLGHCPPAISNRTEPTVSLSSPVSAHLERMREMRSQSRFFILRKCVAFICRFLQLPRHIGGQYTAKINSFILVFLGLDSSFVWKFIFELLSTASFRPPAAAGAGGSERVGLFAVWVPNIESRCYL